MSEPADRFPLELGLWFVPSLLYALGGVLAGVGLYLWPSHIGVALLTLSLPLGEVGGLVARHARVATRWGSELSWHVDVAVSAATTATLGPRAPVALLVVASWAALSRHLGWRDTARVAATMAALAARYA